jgi:hypothetical protein
MTANEEPMSTTNDAAASLRWTVASDGGGGVTATRFVEAPPTETDNGFAFANVEAFRPGNDFITVEMCDSAGSCGSRAGQPSATIQARVVACSCTSCDDEVDNDGDGSTDYPDDPGCKSPDDNDEYNLPPDCNNGDCEAESTITIRYSVIHGRARFLGQLQTRVEECAPDREIVLKKPRPGPDLVVASDLTDDAGIWRIPFPDASGRFYARSPVKRYENVSCLGDRSVTLRIQRD